MADIERKTWLGCECKATDESHVTAVISTETPDRDKEVVVATGLDLKNYRANPIVQFSHPQQQMFTAFELPVGKCNTIKCDRKNNQLMAKVEFAPTEQGTMIRELFKGGFLNAFSVGFVPKQKEGAYGPPTDDELKANPSWKKEGVHTVWRETEMVELSVANIPANPEALAMARKSLDLSPEMWAALGETPMEVKELAELTVKTVDVPWNVKSIGVGTDMRSMVAKELTTAVKIKKGILVFE